MGFLKKIFTWSFPQADKPKGDFDKKESAYYLIGMFGQNLIYNVIGAALSIYYTDVVGVSIVTVGLIFTLCRVWDAINDPVMGVIMEKTRSKYGKCRPWLKYIPFPIAIVTTMLFIPMSTWPMGGRIAFLAIMYFLWSPMYTMGDIPLWSLPSRMTPDESKRTKIISAARIVGSFGAVITAIYPMIKNAIGKADWGLFPNVGLANYDGYFSQEQGYLFTTLIICVLGAILFKFIFVGVRERVTTYDAKPVTFKNSFRLIKKNKPFIRIFLSGLLGCTKTLLLTAGLYFCKWVMGNGNEGIWVIILGAPFLVGMLLSFGFTPKLGVKFGKKKLYLWTSYLSAIPMILLFFIAFTQLDLLYTAGMMAAMLIMLAIFGFFSGFSTSLQAVMIADSVDYLEFHEGERGDGVFAAGLTFIAKLTSGVAILISNVLLGFVNYSPVIEELTKAIKETSDAGGTYALNFAVQYPQITMMMFVLITIVPAIGCILQALPMHGYEISDSGLAEMRLINEERRAKLNAETEGEQTADGQADATAIDVVDADAAPFEQEGADEAQPEAEKNDEVNSDEAQPEAEQTEEKNDNE